MQTAKDLYFAGNFARSQETLLLALAKQESHSSRYAVCLQNLALIEYMNFNFKEAEKLYLKALPITESLCGSDSMATANNLYGLSRCLRRSSQFAEAEPCLSRILTIRTKVLGENHRLVANSLLDIAVNYSKQKKNADALLYFSKAIQLRETLFGKDSPFLVSALNLYARELRLSNDGQADIVDARIRALTSSIHDFVGRPPGQQDEDGSSWQNVGKVPGL